MILFQKKNVCSICALQTHLVSSEVEHSGLEELTRLLGGGFEPGQGELTGIRDI